MFNAPNAKTFRERILPAESGLNGKEWQMSQSVGLITTMIETMVALEIFGEPEVESDVW